MAPRQRFSYILFITLIALFSIQSTASAHVRVVSTSPQENSVVELLPKRVVVEFNEALIIIGAENPNFLTVTSKSGASATIGQAQVRGSTISISLNQALTESGDFTVRYRTVSRDGHRVSGGYVFTLVNQAGVIADPAPTVRPKEGQAPRNSRPMYGILGVLALIAIGGWALYRARFAHRK